MQEGRSWTKQSCLDSCLMEPSCLAVDFNQQKQLCVFHHTVIAACRDLDHAYDWVHFKRLKCASGMYVHMSFLLKEAC